MAATESERRDLILKAAVRLLHHYGPHKTTMAEIAREAAIGVGSVYLEFCSKEAIIEELSTRRHRAVLDAMAAAVDRASQRHTERLAAALDARARAFLDLSEEGAHARDLVHCGNPAVRVAHERFRLEERELVALLLREGHRAGELEVKKIDVTAATVLRAYASFSPPWIFLEPAEDVLKALRSMHDLVLKGLVRRTG